MNNLIVSTATLVITTAACATTRTAPTGLPQEPARPSSIALQLEPVQATDEAPRTFPALVSKAALPSAQRIRRELAGDGHEQLTTRVRLCVAPDGSVAHIGLAQSSGVIAFDQAAMRDVARWQYASYAGPSHVRACEPLTVTFKP